MKSLAQKPPTRHDTEPVLSNSYSYNAYLDFMPSSNSNWAVSKQFPHQNSICTHLLPPYQPYFHYFELTILTAPVGLLYWIVLIYFIRLSSELFTDTCDACSPFRRRNWECVSSPYKITRERIVCSAWQNRGHDTASPSCIWGLRPQGKQR
jgi:hypothetical protein